MIRNLVEDHVTGGLRHPPAALSGVLRLRAVPGRRADLCPQSGSSAVRLPAGRLSGHRGQPGKGTKPGCHRGDRDGGAPQDLGGAAVRVAGRSAASAEHGGRNERAALRFCSLRHTGPVSRPVFCILAVWSARSGLSGTAALLVRRPLVTLLCAALLLGRISGEVAWLHEVDSCAARLPVWHRSAVDSPARARRFRLAAAWTVQPLGAGCNAPVVARWPLGRATGAGVVAKVVARWIPRARRGRPACRARWWCTRSGSGSGRRDLPARLRTAVAGASRTLYGNRAPMVDALIWDGGAASTGISRTGSPSPDWCTCFRSPDFTSG